MSVGYKRAAIPVTIASGQSLSGVVDLGQARLIGIEMPASWTAANLTFQGVSGNWDSTQPGTFLNVFDAAGAEVVVTAAASEYLSLGAKLTTDTLPRFIKVRSGTSGAPINQAADRVIKLVVALEA